MKKTLVILSALIALVGCNKENTQLEKTPNVFNITITHEGDTKAVKAGWEDGDVVYVFFSTVAAPNYVKFSYDGTDWSSTKMGTFDITTAGTMTAIYLPYGNTETVSADGTSFKFGNTYTSYYLKAEKAEYTVSGGVVSGSLNMVVPDGFVQFAMPLTNGGTTQFFRETAGAYTLKENHLTPCAFASVAADGTISNVDSYNAGDPITGYIYGGDINFSGILTDPGHATDYSFNFVNNMGTGDTYDDVTYILTGNKTIAAKAAIKFPLISSNSWKVPEPSYVIVGGYKWATCNIGATSPEGYGDYFSWGAVYPQASYESSDYKESRTSSLDNAHDVAYQKLGENWRMPTEVELKALADATNTTTTINGVVGRSFTGSDGTLFLPSSGFWSSTHQADKGNYWSSIYYSAPWGSKSVYTLIFINGSYCRRDSDSSFYLGKPIRPVYIGE